jgi:hypothetical protein
MNNNDNDNDNDNGNNVIKRKATASISWLPLVHFIFFANVQPNLRNKDSGPLTNRHESETHLSEVNSSSKWS